MSAPRIAAIFVLIGLVGFVAMIIAHADPTMVFVLYVGAATFITLGVVIFLADVARKFLQELRHVDDSRRSGRDIG